MNLDLAENIIEQVKDTQDIDVLNEALADGTLGPHAAWKALWGQMDRYFNSDKDDDDVWEIAAACTRVLLGAGVKPDTACENGRRPLQIAARAGRADLLGMLLEAGSAVEILEGSPMIGCQIERENPGRTALLWAAVSGQTGSGQCIDLLAARGARMDMENQHGKTPVLWAAESGSLEALQALARHGADLRAVDVWGANAMHYAALPLDYEDTDPDAVVKIITWLIEQGLDPEAGDDSDRNTWDILEEYEGDAPLGDQIRARLAAKALEKDTLPPVGGNKGPGARF